VTKLFGLSNPGEGALVVLRSFRNLSGEPREIL
jgi:hypothetical protein